MTQGTSRPYVLDYDEEPKRLEQQARLANFAAHLDHFACAPDAATLDAGCGPGTMTRLLAKRAPKGHATGVDTNQRYLDFARRAAADEGIYNITFTYGDIFHLPFTDHSFDLVWCKYVLQWLHDPLDAVKELKRVTRPGGLVVCCHFDGFALTHYPIDDAWQADAEKVFNDMVDPFMGRKLYGMFHRLGFEKITVVAEPDRLYAVSGAIDAERRENWSTQLRTALPAVTKSMGSAQRAQEFVQRFLAYQDREDTQSLCTLFFVTGRVPLS